MHLGVNISNALQQLESVKAAVDQSDDPKLKVTIGNKYCFISLTFCNKYWQYYLNLTYLIQNELWYFKML